jgi:hypothetical protein
MPDKSPNDTSLIRFPSQHELLTEILRRWWLVCLCVLLGIAWGINSLHSAAYLYPVQMTVTPAQHGTANNVGGGLAALVNLALPSGESGSDFNLYLDLIRSRNIADELAKDPKIMHTVYAGEWDEASQRWRERPETRRLPVAMKAVQDFLGFPAVPWHEPNGESLLGFINYFVTVEQDPRKPYMAKVVMNYGDKEFATQFLTVLHRTADEMLRQRAIKRTTDYIAYLSSTLSKVTVAEHRLALAQALSEQEKAAMVAKSGAPFAAEVLEEPWANSYPSAPQAFQTLARWGFIGALLGCVLALLLWTARTSWRARTVRRSRNVARSPLAVSEQQ